VVSTVLADDAASIKTFDDDDQTTDDENDSVIDAVLKTSIPLASIFSTPKADIADVRKVANETGLHMGLMRRPGAGYDGKLMAHKFDRDEHPWWVVMGRNAAAVRHLAGVDQKGMPGFLSPEKEVLENSSMGFLQVVLAGAIGGAAVAFGMARFL
jgi:hypothetical protein